MILFCDYKVLQFFICTKTKLWKPLLSINRIISGNNIRTLIFPDEACYPCRIQAKMSTSGVLYRPLILRYFQKLELQYRNKKWISLNDSHFIGLSIVCRCSYFIAGGKRSKVDFVAVDNNFVIRRTLLNITSRKGKTR